ncbi:hypothetical protein Q9L58_002624 [Maublancomyces gigas]|uniref:Uncharacterized protein n=1 Tax=Discina gigas TaxID=1032678 RepID=A0ABR3GRH4_9PEZI
MEELPDFIRQDVFQHPNGLVYKLCSDWELTTHTETPPLSPACIADKFTPESTYSPCPDTTLLRAGDHPIIGLGTKNPYDRDHPDYNDTDPTGPCFVKSGWYSDTSTTVAPSVSSTRSSTLIHSLDDFVIPNPHVMPLLDSYNVLSVEDAVSVATDGSHPLLIEEAIDFQQLVEPISPCAYGVWVKQLISRIRH